MPRLDHGCGLPQWGRFTTRVLRVSRRVLDPPQNDNPIKSTFATVRFRTKVTKGPGSCAAGIAVSYRLIDAAPARWRAIDAPHLVLLVRTGAVCHKGNYSNVPSASHRNNPVMNQTTRRSPETTPPQVVEISLAGRRNSDGVQAHRVRTRTLPGRQRPPPHVSGSARAPDSRKASSSNDPRNQEVIGKSRDPPIDQSSPFSSSIVSLQANLSRSDRLVRRRVERRPEMLKAISGGGAGRPARCPSCAGRPRHRTGPDARRSAGSSGWPRLAG